ncbi:uncharacterized protein BJ212DRAFT_1304609 [Suillus subaureus]|uniref:Uncharacterized protein n=1 Tax=Suillus subaureus TaxID=48587 RepID=A0A9P7DUG3_9AGAM|nr:uncharacterized protein BJ212DRAFT_1304609 [Suillus subaureus]KAG1803281.1 hypothetical protein BJ212DRAFT_1304609 [Suillus subaureus]
MSSTQPSSAISWHPNLLAIQGGLSLLTPPSYSFPKDRNYFCLKEVDWILFSAMQTVTATPNNSELKYTGPLFQCLTTIQIIGSGTSHTPSTGQKASWKWLEDMLHHTTSIFSMDSILPLEFSMLPLPSSYSYLHIHKKQSHAVWCIYLPSTMETQNLKA